MQHRKFFILIPIVILGILPLIIMFLWNNIITDLFNIKNITYLQALGLFILSRILFGGFNFRKPNKNAFADRGFREKWISMSDEEKTKMKEEWTKRKNNC